MWRDRVNDPGWSVNADAWCQRHPVLCKVAHGLALVLLISLLCVVLPRLSRAATLVWNCGVSSEGIASNLPAAALPPVGERTPANSQTIPVAADNTDTSGTGICRVASTVSPTWFTRVIDDGQTQFRWATLASIGLGAIGNGSISLSWGPPATNTDGTTPPDLAGYKLYRAGDATPLATFPDPKAGTYTVKGLAPGTYSFDLTAYGSTGSESPRTTSDPVPAVLPAPSIPAPPVNFKAVAPTAYDLVKGTDTLTAKAIGTVPIGTPCLLNVQAMGFYGVPHLVPVLPAGVTRPKVILAKCG